MGKKLNKRWFCIAISIILIFPLSGCWDLNEPERITYAQGLGIDYKDGKYILYVQFINLSLLAKTASGGSSSNQKITLEIGQASGISLEDAIFNLYKTAQRKIHWGHLKYAVLSNDALKHNGLQNVTDILDRYFQTHYHIWMYSTKKALPKILNMVPPINMSTYLTRLSDPTAAFSQYSYIQPIDMRGVIISHHEPPNEITLPLVTNNNTNWLGNAKPRNIVVIEGITVISNNTLKGTITNENTNGLRWIEKKFKRTGLTVISNRKVKTGLLFVKRKVKIDPIIKAGKVQFDIHIKTKATINTIQNNTSISQIRSKAENEIRKEVLNTYQKSLKIDTDIYRLSNVLYKQKWPIWKRIQNNGKIPLAQDSLRNIDVKVEVNDGGKQRKIPTLK